MESIEHLSGVRQKHNLKSFDLLSQVCRLRVVLLGVYYESLNMFLTYAFYTPKVAEIVIVIFLLGGTS